MFELFDAESDPNLKDTEIASGAFYFPELVLPQADKILERVQSIYLLVPPVQMPVKGGGKTASELSCCGRHGWTSSRQGYAYSELNPATQKPWPEIPHYFLNLAASTAAKAGYKNFVADTCLINRYQIGAGMGLHQDSQEKTLTEPVVSLSFGLPQTFAFGGRQRTSNTQKIRLKHGDAIVWGGNSRLNYHSVAPLKAGQHPSTGCCRINLTFRRAF